MSHRPARRARRASASPLFTPHGTDRASRRAARRQLAEAAAKARVNAAAHTSGASVEERQMPPPLFPPAGRPGPASSRNNKLKLPAHRMTTATASGAYPFLAEGGLGAEGIYIGRDVHAEASFVFDPFALYGRVEGFTNPNVLLAGVIGQGKSALAKSFALRSIAFGYRVYVPCDPKGEWTPVAQALGGTSIALGPGLPGKLNPLDAAPRPPSVSETDWAGEIRKRRLLLLGSLARTVLGRDLLPMEHTGLDVALDAVVTRAAESGRTPLLGDIAATLNNPAELDTAGGIMSGRLGDASRDLAHAMRRLVHGDLVGMFDAPSTVTFDPSSPMLTIDLSRLGGSGDDTALVLAMTCASAWMESALSDPNGGRRWIVYDEAWRLMRHPGLLQRMQSQWKLSRGLGIANLMVIHRLSDLLTAGDAGSRGRALAEGLLADCSTRIIYRQETDQLHAAAALLGLTSVETDAIAHLNRGRGLWKVAGRSFIVQHLLHPHELALFDTDARMH
ncbi:MULTISPECIES: ATP-binding protein [Streptomyces]|uniref:ATP-binding protein n=5 Tax=Streptomyces TaxID=1883 RepID=A0ABW9IDD5_STRGJ|nr:MULTISPECIES: ATP-binding protein [Streptomyces]MBP5861430.1 ATP-binding protein [Streptomyces sp. LBUM 1484]MBP5869637.1 ATP-binding protein [Streptomyces sp. LBUM 1485]MBP5908050.1 ATP-binding protein [Streptomyces sp. LBUM 1478]MBP5928971.1 ATP-binding protein [Streptomyces sp. LBUM 1479]KFG02922.1 ATP-binding protein [Streptomyces scabiei]